MAELAKFPNAAYAIWAALSSWSSSGIINIAVCVQHFWPHHWWQQACIWHIYWHTCLIDVHHVIWTYGLWWSYFNWLIYGNRMVNKWCTFCFWLIFVVMLGLICRLEKCWNGQMHSVATIFVQGICASKWLHMWHKYCYIFPLYGCQLIF